MLYQLSYIGPQLPWRSLRRAPPFRIRFFDSGPVKIQQAAKHKSAQNDQRARPQPDLEIEYLNRLVRQRLPRQKSQPGIRGQRQKQLLLNVQLPSPPRCHRGSKTHLVHRGGFEPPYLLRGTDLQSVGFNHSPTCAKTKKRGHTNQNPSKKRRRKLGNETRELPLDTCNQPENTLMECVKTGALSARLRANLPLFPETILWSWRRDLNPRPSDYKSDALPTELRQRLEARSIRRNTSPVPSERTGQLFKVPQR